MKLSIIIPVFNEEKTVTKTVEQVLEKVPSQVLQEVIVVDDGSTDKSVKEIRKINSKLIKLFTLSTNKGKGAAIREGLSHARGKYILIQDADLEYHPQDIVRLVNVLKSKQVEVVYGTRLKRLPHLAKEEKKPLFLLHFFGNRFLSLLVSILYGRWMTDIETCYKLFPRSALSSKEIYSNDFTCEIEITAKLIKKGFRIEEVPITTIPRDYKDGKKLKTIPDGVKALWSLLKYRFIN